MYPIARVVQVRGLVQGVAFRHFTKLEARRLGLAGWVRNQDDGSVECCVEGEPTAVAAMIAWLGHGPPSARVASVEVSEIAVQALACFEVRR